MVRRFKQQEIVTIGGEVLDVVPLTSTLIRQFYPTLLLLVLLTAAHPRRPQAHDPLVDLTSGLESLFHDYVSKLAFLCCTERGGSAVAACAVLQLPDRVQYIVGFNDRDEAQRNFVGAEITTIISMLRGPLPSSASEKAALHGKVLSAALTLAKNRVEVYLKGLKMQLEHCIAVCEREKTSESQIIQQELLQVHNALELAISLGAVVSELSIEPDQSGQSTESTESPNLATSINIPATLQMLEILGRFFKSDTFTLLGPRLAREQRLKLETYWADFLHVAGRLLMYRRTVDLMMLVSNTWPELFAEFEVCTIPSSSRLQAPLQRQPKNVEEIARSIYYEEDVLDRFQDCLMQLSSHNINEDIQNAWFRVPKPLVHAEVLVHNFLEVTPGGLRPERFFHNWKFIGTSKPTCRLCSYFFDEYPTDVQVRRSHHNVYFAWRMPDIYVSQGEEAVATRKSVMKNIKNRLRADIMRIVVERLSDGRRHDSSSYVTLLQNRITETGGEASTANTTSLSLSTLNLGSKQETEDTEVGSTDGTVNEESGDGGRSEGARLC